MGDDTGSPGNSGNSDYIASFKSVMGDLGVSAASASQAMAKASQSMSKLSYTAFPTVDEALDHAMALDKAMTQLREGEGPPDAIRVLAAERAKELGVQVSFARSIVGGQIAWQVTVRTKRGTLHASPSLEQTESEALAFELLPVAAWKNAMREVGLL